MKRLSTLCTSQMLVSIIVLLTVEDLVTAKALLPKSNTYVQRGLNQNSFFQLKLHWEEGYNWSEKEGSLCAQCSGKDCSHGSILLKRCKSEILQQWWSETTDGKINTKTISNKCVTYSNPLRLKTQTCSTDRMYAQLMELSEVDPVREDRFRIRADGYCVTVQGVPGQGARLALEHCVVAEKRNAAYWVRVGPDFSPTSSPTPEMKPNSPTSSPTKHESTPSPTSDTSFLDGVSFQFKLHWEQGYSWTKERNLCAQCINDDCSNGSMFLGECDTNKPSQKWTYEGTPKKILSSRDPRACVSFITRERVTTRPCDRDRDGWQNVEIRQDAGNKFRILSANGECLSITKRSGSDPREVYRLQFVSCRTALDREVAYWSFGAFETTSAPTFSPVNRPSDYVDPNPVPRNPGKGYFNYDARDKIYGPDNWENIDTSDHFLKEFGSNGFDVWEGHLKYDPTENRCGLRARTQSPKNLFSTTECIAWHEIRTKCGYYEIGDDRHKKQILPHKLSVVMNRRRCLKLNEGQCRYPRPPTADQPNYIGTTSSYSDLLNYDIKIPGEHTLEGERFDAEVQMLHLHPDLTSPNQVTSIAVMIRATKDGFNRDFQSIIDEFQDVYDAHKRACERKQEGSRSSSRVEEGENDPSSETTEARKRRGLQQRRDRFDPYTRALMPNIYFYRYNGSLTEPPCLDLPWWVMSEPMIVSHAQLNQAKNILFTHVNEKCEPTSVHNAEQSVARPLFELGQRENDGIQHCTKRDFVADEVKGRGAGRQCS